MIFAILFAIIIVLFVVGCTTAILGGSYSGGYLNLWTPNCLGLVIALISLAAIGGFSIAYVAYWFGHHS